MLNTREHVRVMGAQNWKGVNEVTYHLIRALFPKAEIKLWVDFVNEHKEDLLKFESVITSDRAMDYFLEEPYHTERMLGKYFQKLSKSGLDEMTSFVWEYCDVKHDKKNELVVTYIQRNPPRILQKDLERSLLKKISDLSQTKLQVVDFAALSFKEQINIVANTDVLMGVHGNGFSHTLFLPKKASVIELFPENCFRVEYRIFAKMKQLNYFGIISGSGLIDDHNAETLGAHGLHDVQVDNINIDEIVSIIQNCRKASEAN